MDVFLARAAEFGAAAGYLWPRSYATQFILAAAGDGGQVPLYHRRWAGCRPLTFIHTRTAAWALGHGARRGREHTPRHHAPDELEGGGARRRAGRCDQLRPAAWAAGDAVDRGDGGRALAVVNPVFYLLPYFIAVVGTRPLARVATGRESRKARAYRVIVLH